MPDTTPDFSDPPLTGKVDFGDEMTDQEWAAVRKRATNMSLGNTRDQLGFLVVEAQMENEELARKLKAAKAKIRWTTAALKSMGRTMDDWEV